MKGKHSAGRKQKVAKNTYIENEDITKTIKEENNEEIPKAFQKEENSEIPKAFQKENYTEYTPVTFQSENEDVEQPEILKQKNEGGRKMKTKAKKKHGKLKLFGKIILTLIIILALLIGGIFWYVNNKFSKMQKVELNESDLGISTEVDKSLSGYRNIAIFGVDSRSDDYGVGNRSDCIIIASINNSTGDIKLISVYRDTYVNIDGHGLDKITHAYSYGEAPLAISTLNKNLDLNIKEFVTVNFDSVAEAVDQLGGITLSVTAEETKYINEYIDETSRVTGKSSKHITQAGTYNLDGVQAVSYSRIRYTAGGDYKRTERMRTVIEAMFNKIKTKNVSEINKFADKILPSVYTNITAGDIISLVPNLAKYKVGDSIGWPYQTKGITLDKWYGVPVTLESNVTQLHKEAFGESDYTPSQTVKSVSDSIIKKTGYNK